MDAEPAQSVADSPCDEARAYAALAALAVDIAPEEAVRLTQHLTGCAACRSRQSDYRQLTQLLLRAVPPAEPSPALRERIVAAAAAEPRRTQPQPARLPRRRLQQWLLPAFVVLALLCVGWALSLQQQLQQQQQQLARNRALVIAAFGNADAQEYQLNGTPSAPTAEGRVFVSPGQPALAMYVKNLPPSPPDHVYRLWLNERGGGPIAVATFSVDASGRAWVIAKPPAPLGRLAALSITLERDPGGAAPSGPLFLSATLPG